MKELIKIYFLGLPPKLEEVAIIGFRFFLTKTISVENLSKMT